MYKSKKAKATDIPMAVKKKVWERDSQCCIFCGSPNAAPNMHFIPRSHGGLGIEQNIGTGCQECHHKLDNTEHRAEMLVEFEIYLKSKYENWNLSDLIYDKWKGYPL